MLGKNNFFMAIGLVTGCLVINNASAGNYSDQQLAIDGLRKQEQKATTTADTSLRDAELAFIEARHILQEDKHNPGCSDNEVKQLKQLVNKSALNLQRTQKIAGRIEGLRFEV